MSVKHVLSEALHEIESLRRRNEVLEAKVEVLNIFGAALLGPRTPQGMSPDVCWAIRQGDRQDSPRGSEGSVKEASSLDAMHKDCGQCYRCLEGKTVNIAGHDWPVTGMRMVVCETCGNKRCPHATDCRLACTNSNEPGQKGSHWEDYKL